MRFSTSEEESQLETSPEAEWFNPLAGPEERLRMIHEDLLKYAPPAGEEDGWEELKRALDEGRPEGMKLFPD